MAIQVTPTMPGPNAEASQRDLRVRIRKSFGGSFTLDAGFTAPPGITMLFGASGAGKTTLLDCIAGLQHADSGLISSGDHVFFDSSTGANLRTARRRVGYVFQTLALFPHLSAADNVAYGLAQTPSGDRSRRVAEILQRFRVSHAAGRRPSQISGGERQRVALARALVIAPSVLLLDEPLSALDAATKSHIMDDLRAWNEAAPIPILYVTHSREEVFALGDRAIFLEQGKVLAEGTPHEVLSAPRQEAAAQLAGFENIFDARVIGLHESQGTMTCEVGNSGVHLEAPLGRIHKGEAVRLGIRAGDILLASRQPEGLSARNVLEGTIASLTRRDVTVIAEIDCGVRVTVHLTPGAQQSLGIAPGARVWLVIKTYSCHLLRK